MTITDSTQGTLRYRWWFKGKAADGNILSFEGYGWAEDAWAAAHRIDKLMREEYPDIRWMHGTKVEGGNIQYGPTIKMLKKKRPTP